MLLTDLTAERTPGPDAGSCYLCGSDTASGHKQAPSDNFTAWAGTYGGSVICERCYPLLKERPYRMQSWMATTAGVRFTGKDDRAWLWRALLHPPDPPLAIYVTRGGQKQGWISLLRYVSTGRERLWVGTDWTDRPVLLEATWVAPVAALIAELRARGVSKRKLESGGYTMKDYETAMKEGYVDRLEAARRHVTDPRWEVLVLAHADG